MTKYSESPGLRQAIKDLVQTVDMEQLAVVAMRNMDAIEAITEIASEVIEASPVSAHPYDEGHQRGQEDLARKVLEAIQREMTK